MIRSTEPHTIGDDVPQSGKDFIPTSGSFTQKSLNAAAQAPLRFIIDIGGRQHDERQMPRLLVSMDLIDKLETIHLRHHQVEEDDVRLDERKPVQGNSTVLGLCHFPSILPQDPGEPSPGVRIILYNQHPRVRMVGSAGSKSLQ